MAGGRGQWPVAGAWPNENSFLWACTFRSPSPRLHLFWATQFAHTSFFSARKLLKRLRRLEIGENLFPVNQTRHPYHCKPTCLDADKLLKESCTWRQSTNAQEDKKRKDTCKPSQQYWYVKHILASRRAS